VFLKKFNENISKSGRIRMINLKMPSTAIVLKKPKIPPKHKFIVTYEYKWSESADADDSKEHEPPQEAMTDLRMPIQCSWTNVTISFAADRRFGGT
jgi:hypothetical protein